VADDEDEDADRCPATIDWWWRGGIEFIDDEEEAC
jgi:hypothetical protein